MTFPGMRDAKEIPLVRIPVTASGTVQIDSSTPVEVNVANTPDIGTLATLTTVTNPVDTRPSTVTGSPTLSRVATSTTSASILASNSNRRGAIVRNEAADTLLSLIHI